MIPDNLNVRLLRHFVVVAEELHFTRAAERLRMRQPPLSMQIRHLEEMVGVQLFRRLPRGIQLTAAGQAFFIEAKEVLSLLGGAVAQARRLASGESGRLRVGFAGATYYDHRVPELVRRYRQTHPGVELTLEQNYTPALVERVANGRLDVAFVRPVENLDGRVKSSVLFTETFVFVLPDRHAPNGDSVPDAAWLGRQPLVMFDRENGPGLYDTIIQTCRRLGFEPHVGQHSSRVGSIVPLVSAGFGIAIVPQSVSSIHAEGVVFREIDRSIATAPVAIIWRMEDHSEQVVSFLRLATVAKRRR